MLFQQQEKIKIPRFGKKKLQKVFNCYLISRCYAWREPEKEEGEESRWRNFFFPPEIHAGSRGKGNNG